MSHFFRKNDTTLSEDMLTLYNNTQKENFAGKLSFKFKNGMMRQWANEILEILDVVFDWQLSVVRILVLIKIVFVQSYPSDFSKIIVVF